MPPSDMGGALAATDDVRTAAKARKVRLPRTPDVLFPPRRVPSSMVYLGFELSLTILHAPPLPPGIQRRRGLGAEA